MSCDIEGRVAIVTGSSSGIGEAAARRLAELGAHVVVNSSTSVEQGAAVAESLPTESFYVRADIASEGERNELIARTLDRFGQLDVLVNNAGWTTVVPHGDLDALTDEIFRRTFEVNVFGTWELTKAAIPHLRRSSDGNVVTVTSVAGHRPGGSSIAYAMSKAALNHMTHLLAKSHGPVRFNTVAPGLVDTPWTADWHETRSTIHAITPLHRSATPADIADAVAAFVCNGYATGSSMVVDGGLSQVF